ncbi:hypothetical protein [Arenicella chitinivorans]|uniref:hypothetical protein n=1 Tax=Arenicella chitinivorans TaxID=1329800 RepID=UPI00167C2730|nr:hypothetical protein [Arenicella chitinivorans]
MPARSSNRIAGQELKRQQTAGHRSRIVGQHLAPSNIISGQRRRARPHRFVAGTHPYARIVHFTDPGGTRRRGLEPGGTARASFEIRLGADRSTDFARADASARRAHIPARRATEVWHHHHAVRIGHGGRMYGRLFLMDRAVHEAAPHFGSRHVGGQHVTFGAGIWS